MVIVLGKCPAVRFHWVLPDLEMHHAKLLKTRFLPADRFKVSVCPWIAVDI